MTEITNKGTVFRLIFACQCFDIRKEAVCSLFAAVRDIGQLRVIERDSLHADVFARDKCLSCTIRRYVFQI